MGQRIRQQRRAAGLTQKQLAGAVGVSLGALRDLEQGRTQWPRCASVEALIAGLGLSYEGHGQQMLGRKSDLKHRRPAGTCPCEPARPHDTGTVRIGVLGPLVATRAGQPIDLGPARQRAVLGLLGLGGRSGTRLSEVTELLWWDQPPTTAPTMVQGYVSRLRRLLEPVPGPCGHRYLIAWTGQRYQLQVGESCEVDIAAFRRLARHGHDAMALA
jgi:hypothetical protein